MMGAPHRRVLESLLTGSRGGWLYPPRPGPGAGAEHRLYVLLISVDPWGGGRTSVNTMVGQAAPQGLEVKRE